MAITDITLVTTESNYPIAVHSPFYIIWQAVYSGAVPTSLTVEISEDGITYETGFKAIPYSDPLATVRQFMFRCDAIVRGFMTEFEDVPQSENSLLFLDDFSKKLWIRAKDDTGLIVSEFEGVFLAGVRQFGTNEVMSDINENKDYIAAKAMPCYLYFFNDDENNVITVGQSTLQLVIAEDYNDDDFTDYNDVVFEIDIEN